jgi:4-hydroxythreonine-4-phosphate dehydrogenase
LPTIAISSGDPAGIGPEVTVKALADSEVRRLARWIIVADTQTLSSACSDIPWRSDLSIKDARQLHDAWNVAEYDCPAIKPGELVIGQPSAAGGRVALEFVRIATELCLQGVAQAMVTAPVSKEAVALSGRHFSGHTEYIAELCGVSESRMLLVNDRLRVVHVTTHCGLAAAAQIDRQRVLRTLVLGHEAMQRLGWPTPRIAVCGLNPHAGENGLFGDQESRVIGPAVEDARKQGIDCTGPHPADTLFLQAVRGKYDLVVAMYHDQGHIPIKLLDFEHTVNISLGLPIIRTSVDHGTAFDIAGKNMADASDMKTAMRYAVELATPRGETA